MARISWFLIVILLSSYVCESYKILLVFPFPSKSHGILGEGYVKFLLEAGHELTYITAFPLKNDHPNLRQVDVSYVLDLIPIDKVNLRTFLDKEGILSQIALVFKVITELMNSVVANKDVQELMNDTTQHFDVAVIEWGFSELTSGFAAVFDCPYIWSSSLEPHLIILSLIDEISNPAYVPSAQSANTIPMTFWQRVKELFNFSFGLVLRETLFSVMDNSKYKEMFGPSVVKRGRTLPPYEVMRYNASLVLGNSHPSLGLATRLPQSYINIGGYHIDTNVKPLPEDLKKIMDEAKYGVIYFSMGSILRSKDLPQVMKDGLLKVFGGLKQTVIWKFEEDLFDLPNNVRILQWVPQQSVLAHPNCHVFITHGGLLSTTESIHFGVPLIAIPVFGDQFNNAERMVKKGIGRKVDLSYAIADELKEAIEDVINNPSYTEKVKALSAIYHDRPVPPGKELVHWVEHVARTRGAPHLRSPALHLAWYQKMYLDLLALVIATVFGLKILIKRLPGRRKSTVSLVKKKN